MLVEDALYIEIRLWRGKRGEEEAIVEGEGGGYWGGGSVGWRVWVGISVF